MKFDPREIECAWRLGFIPDSALPGLALDALLAGFESEPLIVLSVCGSSEIDAIRQEFDKVVGDFGDPMSIEAALLFYAKTISSQILAGTVTPLCGAQAICRASWSAGLAGFHDLDGFIYAESEMEDRPKDVGFFERAIREEARCLIERMGRDA